MHGAGTYPKRNKIILSNQDVQHLSWQSKPHIKDPNFIQGYGLLFSFNPPLLSLQMKLPKSLSLCNGHTVYSENRKSFYAEGSSNKLKNL